MHFTTTIKLVLKDEPDASLSNVKVGLFDKDTFSKDDALGTAVTDENGEARFQYTTEQFADLDERLGTEFPDLYAVVYDGDDQIVMNTRAEVIKRITVAIDRDLASKHRLLPA